MTDYEEDKLCVSNIKGLARHNRESHAKRATDEEEGQRVQCNDDITGKELPWSEDLPSSRTGIETCARS